MKRVILLIAIALFVIQPANAESESFQSDLLDQLEGDWVLRGIIAGNEVTHDVTANWVLNHNYLQFHEISREVDKSGSPLYQATVLIGWDQPSGRYVCLWLDSTGGGGLANDVFGYAKPESQKLSFVFGDNDGRIHNSLVYDPKSRTWDQVIENEKEAVKSLFAHLTWTQK